MRLIVVCAALCLPAFRRMALRFGPAPRRQTLHRQAGNSRGGTKTGSPATGTLDPLFARVLVLEAGERRLALGTLDLGRSFGPASLDRLRKSAKQSSGISYLLVTASHTHSARDSGRVMRRTVRRLGADGAGNRASDSGSDEQSGGRADRNGNRGGLHRPQPPPIESRWLDKLV